MDRIANGDGVGCEALGCDESWCTQCQTKASYCEKHFARYEMDMRQCEVDGFGREECGMESWSEICFGVECC